MRNLKILILSVFAFVIYTNSVSAQAADKPDPVDKCVDRAKANDNAGQKAVVPASARNRAHRDRCILDRARSKSSKGRSSRSRSRSRGKSRRSSGPGGRES